MRGTNYGIVNERGNIQGNASVQNDFKTERAEMNNTFNAPVGVVANEAHDFELSQDNRTAGRLDMTTLASELGRLRAAARQEATDAEHDMAVAELARAESAAKNKDEPEAMKHLKDAGKWALDVATKIGTTIAAEAIKRAMFPT